MSQKYVYFFSEGNANMKELLGGKGANLAEMTNLGLPVPNGFIVTTEACNKYYDEGGVLSTEIEEQIVTSLAGLEKLTGKNYADPENLLLLSVRSGARASMPGMMNTVLNLGLTDETVAALAQKNERFAYDSQRRFIQMFSDVVMEIPNQLFESVIDEVKEHRNVKLDTELTTEDLKELVDRFKEIYKKEKGADFPQDPRYQLIESVKAVFRSWDKPSAVTYRRLNEIPSEWGTAVNIQEMVFGNMGNDCGTGVIFSRNPASGENKLYGEFLMNAQGEDVVAGVRTPNPIDELRKLNPGVYVELLGHAKRLESYFKDMQDMEFTIEKGHLFVLQTRNGKRTADAALRIAVDMVNEKMITREEALMKVEPKQLDMLLHPNFDQKKLAEAKPVASGLAASPGAATGKIVFSAEEAVERFNQGEKDLVLVRLETSPEDIEGMHVCNGILTARGGMTSHAAVVARSMGTCCVAGCDGITIREDDKYLIDSHGKKYTEDDYISIDGTTGNVYGEKIATVEAEVSGAFATFMNWADEFRRLRIRANADTPTDAKIAYGFGAEGIGLCRTEHMFFEADRISAMREMIVSKTLEQRIKALEKILPMQKEDFEELYKEMKGYPVTIRLLDPPLHEFVPREEPEIRALAKEMGLSFEEINETIDNLHEYNPMMGHRGCRVGITYSEITAMQTKAIIEAAISVNRQGMRVVPEIMIPLVGEVNEFKFVKEIIVSTAEQVIEEADADLHYMVGTMIEIPRAVVTADVIAREAEFFSFGTNDLTQMTFGFSRDDAGKFLRDYMDNKIYESDPFVKLDQTGVGELVKMAVNKGKEGRPTIKLGVCGEHGGEPSSVEFFHKVGLDYVSCSPFRVPIARLAAAQAALKEQGM
ncbi:MAG: pyruvate, phosphate dikinase [Peptococcaceae bacterium]|nr:pyruvate, phosphate dikinase [Peptococcaceae bacterium]